MKTSQGGYKAMIRDRVPSTVDLALRWCKAKTRWVEYVYYTYAWFLEDKENRDYQVRCILGLAKNCRSFDFDNTIEWKDLSKEELEYWTGVSKWVKWFTQSVIPISESYKTHLLKGDDSEYTKRSICEAYMNKLSPEWQDKLYEHVINHIKEYYV